MKLIGLIKGVLERKKLKKLKDNFTFDILKVMIENYNKNMVFIEHINKQLSIKKCRNENFPSHISENIVKFVLCKKYNIMPLWDTKSGDLELCNKKLEVKAFMSVGPTSFGPKENWDYIYFVDAMDTKNLNYKVYEIKLSNCSSTWKNIIFSQKSGTYNDISIKNQRGNLRANFYKIIKPQIDNHCVLIFDGHLNDIH
jgi:hypothetical protein